MTHALTLLGYASGVAANNADCALGPWYLYYHPQLLQARSIHASWLTFIKTTSASQGVAVFDLVKNAIHELSQAVLSAINNHTPFCVIGGDHSCAIATWSAVAHAQRDKGDIGLIWIDAHMDSHTPESTLSHNLHGMPLAHLLGYGDQRLCHLLDDQPKLQPQNVCLIGIRSYEASEQALLERLGVKIYFMHEVQTRGVEAILQEACERVCAQTCGFGLSIDLDAIDPKDAPGVGYQEPEGIDAKQLLRALQTMPYKNALLGLEIAEFNPLRDESCKTAHLLADIIQAIHSIA